MQSYDAMVHETPIPTISNTRVTPMPIEYLESNPFQVRVVDISGLGPLISSIEKYGFVGHLEARNPPGNPGGRKELVYGHRRLRAAELAGLKTVPVKTVERSDSEMREFAYIENGTVEPLSYWEEALHFKQLQDTGMSMIEIAETIGKSKGYVQGRMDVLRLEDPEMRAAAQAGQYEMTVFNVLVTMGEDERRELWEHVKAGKITATDLRNIRAQMNRPLSDREDIVLAETIAITGSDHLISERLGHPSAAAEIDLELDADVPGPDPGTLIRQTPVRKVFPNSVTFQPLSGRDWAERLLIQLRGIVPIMEQNVSKADWSTLTSAEHTEIETARTRLNELLTIPVAV